MALCRRCALNGNERNGGDLGVCKLHAKSKCRFFGCEARTLGEELCTTHAHEVEVARWTAESEFRVIDPESELDLAEMRREKLLHAKFLAHQAVEVFFKSLLAASAGFFAERIAEDQDEKKAA